MATISKQPVTLTVLEAEALAAILSTYAGRQWEHARKTKSAAIQAHCQTQGAKARDLEQAIVRRLYQQTEERDCMNCEQTFPDDGTHDLCPTCRRNPNHVSLERL